MYQFFVFARKECYHIFRDRRTLLILFGMPVVQIILFGFAITNEIKHAKIAVLDQANDHYSQQLTARLQASGYFDVVQRLRGQQAITPAFREGDIKMTVVIPPGFTQDFFHKKEAQVQLLADASDPNTATTLVNYATVIITGYQQELSGQQALPLTIHTLVRMAYNPSLKSVFLFVPGVMTLILLLVSAMMTSITIAREKELGTMEILLVSPLPPALIIVGKVVPYILLSFINALVILGLGVTMFGMPVKGSLVLLLLECVLFVLTSLSLGILISTVTATQQAAMMASMMGLLMPTVMLSGFVFPIESMPKPLQIISNVMPARWFISILKDIMLKGSGLKDIWVQTVILFGMTLFFIGLSIRKFKIRLS
ncbi:ABC transporter permease [Chitinophaga pendula]|uniref:ABC transporter permease n=1 Tax=Chitinophaga TaxID=79328 RepID=UPI000BB0225F|nr:MULTISPECIES: ABC transporter permease [Chitinophaga]ASZ13774.1 multidrug ABC transporter permease [Chitinophaga sp. MD30]UCJ08606.1 ABC transporter permease [Chitinophaga pendula]